MTSTLTPRYGTFPSVEALIAHKGKWKKGDVVTTTDRGGDVKWEATGNTPVAPLLTLLTSKNATISDANSNELILQDIWPLDGRVWGIARTEDGGTFASNAAAGNAMAAYMRKEQTTLEKPVTAIFPQGDIYTDEMDFTVIRSNGWFIKSEGTNLIGSPGITTLNLLGSRKGTIYNITAQGGADDASAPRMGIAIGYIQGSISSSEMLCVNCFSEGHFLIAGKYNEGSEEVTDINCQWENESTLPNAHGHIVDGYNFFGPRSPRLELAIHDHIAKQIVSIVGDLVTTKFDHGFVVGHKLKFWDVTGLSDIDDDDFILTVGTVPTSTTFTVPGTNEIAASDGYANRVFESTSVNIRMINTNNFNKNGGTSLWISANVSRFDMQGYAFSKDVTAIRIYFNEDIGESVGQENSFDIVTEGDALVSAIELYEAVLTTRTYDMGSWRIRDAGTKVDGSYFSTNALTSTFVFTGLDLSIATFTGGSNALFDDPARYKVVGKIGTRNTSGMTGLPAQFSGSFETRDAQSSTVGVGSYDLDMLDLDGAQQLIKLQKGTLGFIGDKSDVISDLAAEVIATIETKGLDGFGHYTSNRSVSVAIDNVAEFDMPANSAKIGVTSNSTSGPTGEYWARVSTATAVTNVSLMTGGVLPDLTVGVLTGTTGTIGNITFSCDHTTKKFYVENRTVATIKFSLIFLGAL